MNMKSQLSLPDKFSFLMGLLGILVFIFIWQADPNFTTWLAKNTKKQSCVDIASALFWLSASIICIYRIKHSSQSNNFLLYFWAIFSFLCAGEELKWGYRFFHYSIPALQNINYQHDVSLHNLNLTGTWFISPQKLFYLGFFTYFFVVPFLTLLDKIKPLKKKLYYTTPGIYFFLATWVTIGFSVLIPYVFTPRTPLVEYLRVLTTIAETREMFCAFVVLSYVFFYLSADFRPIWEDSIDKLKPSREASLAVPESLGGLPRQGMQRYRLLTRIIGVIRSK